MAKPLGIVMGIVGAKPVPPDVAVEHMKSLNVTPASSEPAPPDPVKGEPSSKRRSHRKRARSEDGQFVGDNPATPEVNEAWSPTTEADGNG